MLKRKLLIALLLATAVVISACDNSKDVDPPAKLVDIKPALKVKKLWTQGWGSRKAKHYLLALQPAVDSGTVYIALHSGKVQALDTNKGSVRWSVRTKLPLSAGPAVGEGVVVVGASNGMLVVLDAATGQEKWRLQMSGEVLAKPLVAKGLIVVRTVNDRVQALNLSDAKSRWSIEEAVPKLTLRGTAPPVLDGNAVIVGFDDGKVVSADLQSGDTLWSVGLDTPVGRTELERLADVDAAAVAVGHDVFAVGYHGRVAMLDESSGQVWWAHDASSYRGMATDDSNLYISEADGTITAIKRVNGGELWQQKALHQRQITAAAVYDGVMVVGDYKGYLHWLSTADGKLLARAKTGVRISNAPVYADGKVFVQNDAGELFVFRTAPKKK